MDVTCTNVSMTGFEMCTLLMRMVSDKIADEYNFLQNSVPTDPKKLVKELTKIEDKIESSSKSAPEPSKHGQAGPPSEAQTPKDKHHKSKGSRTKVAAPIPWKAENPPRDTDVLCALCDKNGGAAKYHTIIHYKRWTGAGKDHPAWRERTALTNNLNAHAGGDDINSLVAQQAEFNASIMKTVDKVSKKKKRKSKRSSHYSS